MTIISFLVALGVIVFVHEFGHHVVARLCGVRVVTFSLGFGKRLWGFEHQGTDYRVSMIPLGGYVRMAGEHPEESSGEPGDFLTKPRWQRILVYLAGPAMNVVLSVALITALFMVGIQAQRLQSSPSVIGHVLEDSAGEAAGLRAGDWILKVNDEKVSKWKELSFIVGTSPEKELHLVVERGGETFETVLTPSKDPQREYGDAGLFPKLRLRFSQLEKGKPAHEAGFLPGDEVRLVNGRHVGGSDDFIRLIESNAGVPVEITVLRGADETQEEKVLTVVPEDQDGKGKIGVRIEIDFPFRKLPFTEALLASVEFNYDIVRQSVIIIGKLFTGEMSAKSSLSGPIEIAVVSGEAARRGLTDYLFIMGFLSISIGFMNLLPIPVLDGGHITILLLESVMRRDLSMIVKERITQVGFMMLMMLMAMVIAFDLMKNLPSLIPGG